MSYHLDFSFLMDTWPMFIAGVWQTILLAGSGIVMGFVIGAASAVVQSNGGPKVRATVGAYVEIIRNTPFLVQILLIYFGLAGLNFRLSATVCAVLALAINTGAYTSEIMRAGIESIHRGQIEAAECLGLSRLQVYAHIVLLPAMERVYPALSSQFILLLLASSITSQISAEELTAVANFVQSRTFRSFEVYIIVAVLYLGLSLFFRWAFWLVGLAIFPRRRKLGATL